MEINDLYLLQLSKETQEHMKTKEELENNKANFKQLNRGKDSGTFGIH